MSFHGRSPDDMPLAAYSTGAPPDDVDESDDAGDPGYTSVPAPALSTADMQHGHVSAAEPAPITAIKVPRRRLSLPFRLPALGRSKAAAMRQAAPFQPVAGAAGPAAAFQAVTGAAPASTFQAAPAYPVAPPFEPAARPIAGQRPIAPPGVKSGTKAPPKAGPRARRLPPLSVRDPRVLAGGAVVVGLALLGISLLGGGGPGSGAGGPGSSNGSTAVQPTPAAGNATVELTSGETGMYPLAGATGGGPAVKSQLNATWTDSLGNALAISGLASQGTRATDPNFSLTWTMLINGAAVTFSSRAAECTVGMAVGATTVHGTFVCKELASTDGKHVVGLRGTYTT